MRSMNLRITIRVEQKHRNQLDKALSDGKGKNISDLVRIALNEFLEREREGNATE
jgi:Arc/MetJ-type ribon-helix-helix transcriptional regulator